MTFVLQVDVSVTCHRIRGQITQIRRLKSLRQVFHPVTALVFPISLKIPE